ncbi:HD-GYP domain, c-di-GMP phosphodiesterase class II (or its inactivated variant) [Cohnella sp. OV330]|uniref:HD-GYP domain-containing protein n=1 Tax=Cohnella sp. OV330 TaxID=1855288 RepID=UPI0008E01960|nr:HD-GYP domain-containing protein [Cohnella sp. OV330]SFB53046.1 HD-GYP domain, c-di-GMP phosphodiesterase class II (or its inactivated variant) [Cohnella sp. OV330]
MAVLPVSQVQTGDLLLREVQTSFGNMLFPEGRTLSARDLEILQAYLIPDADIKRAGLEESDLLEIEEDKSVPLSSLHQNFLKMERLLKHTFQMMGPGQKLPIFEIRGGLKDLLDHIDEYHVLTFVPPYDPAAEPWIRGSVLTALTGYQLAKWMKLPEKDWVAVALSGLLHDIGNTRIDSTILRKPGRLTTDELTEMRQHTVYGYKLLEGVTSLNQGIILTALQHHERIDGSGYPMKAIGDKIHPYAKIVAIADMYHAMTSARSYRTAQSPYIVLEQLQKEAFGKLDPLMIQCFIERNTQFYNGMLVQLNDNRVGEIVFTDRANPTRPMVSIFGEIVNLAKDRNLFITAVYSS